MASHHIFRDRAFANPAKAPGYKYNGAPSILLNRDAHQAASNAQRRGTIGGSLADEHQVSIAALIAAGKSPAEAVQIANKALKYYTDDLGLGLGSALGVPFRPEPQAMTDRPPYLPIIGVAVPLVLDGDWTSVENMTRWVDSVPPDDVREFIASLPGEPIEPTGQEIIDNLLVLDDDGDQLRVIVPIQLDGGDAYFGLAMHLSQFEGQTWLWGFDHPQLLTEAELATLRSPTPGG